VLLCYSLSLGESFYTILFEKLAKVDAIILCEGRSDVEVVKAVFKKLIGASGGLVIGLTVCSAMVFWNRFGVV
jgi:hypothetical protein